MALASTSDCQFSIAECRLKEKVVQLEIGNRQSEIAG